MTQKNQRMIVISRVMVVVMGAALMLSFAPQCGMYLQLREVAGYYECVRPADVKESINISGYGVLSWSAGGKELAQYLFELQGAEKFRMSTADGQGKPTVWQNYSYTREGDELYFNPRLSGSGCERWVSRKAPSRNVDPKSVPNILE